MEGLEQLMPILFSFSLFQLGDQKYGVCGYKIEQKLKIPTFGIMTQKQKFTRKLSFPFLFSSYNFEGKEEAIAM